jgi:rhodanese-related sulfurtransferase
MIDSEPGVIVLDVRTENEYEAGHIAGAELVPLSELEQRTGELDKDDALLVYCKSGTKSVEASNILIQYEFESVYNMEGGINAWVNAGYPVVSSSICDQSGQGCSCADPQSSITSTSNNLLSSEIDAILDAGKPVFLFFHADWCHFCQEQMPIIEELELEYVEEIVVIHVNNEDNPQAMTEFGVMAFPTMFLISDKSADGQYRYQEFAGFTDREILNQSFDRVITNGNISEGPGADSDGITEDEPIECTAFQVKDFPWDVVPPDFPWENLPPSSELEDLCPYCPEPQLGWGDLIGCLCKASHYDCERPYDRTSWVMPYVCVYQYHSYRGPEVTFRGHRIQFPIAPPTSDYCIDEELIMLHRCYGCYIYERPCRCPYGCEDGQCICSDTDGGKDYYEQGGVRNGTAVVPGTTDYCLNDKVLMESWTEINPQADTCTIRWEEHECPYACRNGTCAGNCYDKVQNQDEQGVDCGGSECPASCIDCFDDNAFGGAEDAEYLKLGSIVVINTALQALAEYVNCVRSPSCLHTLIQGGMDPSMDYSTVTANDLAQSTDNIMAAVAHYVDRYTTYMTDEDCDIDDIEGVTSAESMILKSGSRSGTIKTTMIIVNIVTGEAEEVPLVIHVDTCPTLYCGDCEDYAIFREALMRSLGVSWRCAFCADHDDDYWGGGHAFNLVYYRNRWRIMDYHALGYYFSVQQYWDQHRPHNIWNDRLGEYNCPDWKENLLLCSPINPYSYTQNYNGGDVCCGGAVGTYYRQYCP